MAKQKVELLEFIDALYDTYGNIGMFNDHRWNGIKLEDMKQFAIDWLNDCQTEENEARAYAKIPPEHFENEENDMNL